MKWVSNIFKNHWRKIIIGTILCCVALALVINYETQNNENITTATKTSSITLTISGEVVRPGVYEIKKDSSIMDNVHRFGGFTMYADLSKIDIDAPLTKDTQISIKTRPVTDNRNYDQLYSIP